MKKVKKLFIDMMILTITALIMRTIGVSFSAYLFNRVGASAIGVYQLILSVYAFTITVATSGIKFTVTRLVSEELGKGNGRGIRQVIKRCFCYALFFSSVTAIILFFSAHYIGTNWLDDFRTISSLRILAVGLPFIAISHVIAGYFTAMRKVSIGSAVMMIDQLIMIVITLLGLRLLFPKGLEYICIAMVIGAVVSEIITCILLWIGYLIEQKKLSFGNKTIHIWSRLLNISLPIAFSAYARSGLYTLQNILIPKGLRKHGASSDAAFTAYGTVHGMVLPLVLYPSALMIALSELLIPELTECQVKNNHLQIHYIIHRVLKFCFLFTVGVMGVLFYFSNELSYFFDNHDQVAFYLRLLAPLVLVMYMDTVVDGMLKGLGQQLQSMKYNVIDAFFSVLMVYFLIPLYGIQGYIITVMVSELLNFTLSLLRLIKVTQIRIQVMEVVCKPLLAIALAIVVSYLFLHPNTTTDPIIPQVVVVQILLMIGLYVTGLWASSCLTKDDFRWFMSIVK